MIVLRNMVCTRIGIGGLLIDRLTHGQRVERRLTAAGSTTGKEHEELSSHDTETDFPYHSPVLLRYSVPSRLQERMVTNDGANDGLY